MEEYPIYAEFADKIFRRGDSASFFSPLFGEEINTKPIHTHYEGRKYTVRFLDPYDFCSFGNVHWLPEFCKKHGFGMFVYEEKTSGKHEIHIYVTEDPNERLVFDTFHGELRHQNDYRRIGAKKVHIKLNITDKCTLDASMGFWRIDVGETWTHGGWRDNNFQVGAHYREEEKLLVFGRSGVYKIITALKLYFGLWNTNDEDYEIMHGICGRGDYRGEENEKLEVLMNFLKALF